MITIIAACTSNWALGKDSQLLFHLPQDLRRFKSITLGKPIIMGRKTFQSIGKPLPDRKNIVISKSISSEADEKNIFTGCQVFDDLEKGLDYAKEWYRRKGVSDKQAAEIMIIGGAHIYAQTIAKAQRMHITEIVQLVENCDAFFPQYKLSDWKVLQEESYIDNYIPCRYRLLERKG